MFIDTGVRKTHSMIGDSVAFCSARLGAQKVRYVYITVRANWNERTQKKENDKWVLLFRFIKLWQKSETFCW